MIGAIGWIATGLLALCYIPQIYETYTTKTVEGVSVVQWIILAIGFSFSITYAVCIKAWPIVAGNSWGFLCSLIIIAMYYKYKRK